MNRINQESVARRFQSFDTELPRVYALSLAGLGWHE
jgi:hypothetical protein